MSDESKAPRLELPAAIETAIVNWANPKTCPGGRADDAMIHLTTADKRFLGTLTLGWFREHTSVVDGEDSLIESIAEAQADANSY